MPLGSMPNSFSILGMSGWPRPASRSSLKTLRTTSSHLRPSGSVLPLCFS